LGLAGGYKSQRAYPARKTASVIRVIQAVHDRDLREVEGTYPIQAGDVHTILVLIGSALMMRVDPAFGAEEVLRRSSVETVTCQRVLTLQEPDPTQLCRDRYRAAHPAIGASAAADGIESVSELHFKANRAAMAPASPYVCFACHGALILAT